MLKAVIDKYRDAAEDEVSNETSIGPTRAELEVSRIPAGRQLNHRLGPHCFTVLDCFF